MEPLKPDTKRTILQDRPGVGKPDLEEYERLLAQRFSVDPDAPASADASQARETRLAELHAKLFGREPAEAGAQDNREELPKYGARIYLLASGKGLVKQTIKKQRNGDYVVDGHRERHVDLADDAQVADAIRTALAGQMAR
jgi:hypothetical protein